jgi:iron complex outermembrane receptor protein
VGQFNWPYTQKTDSYAVFGQIDQQVGDRLTLTGGLRWSADEKRFDYRSLAEEGSIVLFTAQDSRTFSDWSGRLGASYELSPTARTYATFNRGYKSGGFFGGQATDPAQVEPYKNETLNAYELGLKSEIFDRRVTANLSAFYYDYANQQVFSLEVRNGLTTQILTNAGSSRAYGGELQISGNPIRPLSIDLAASYLNTRILRFVSAGQDYAGNPLQHSPKWTLSGSATYTADLPGGSALILNANANWRTRIYFDNTKRLRVSEGAKTVVDGQIGWRSPSRSFEAGVFAKNLLDTTYLLGMSPIDSLGFDALNYAQPRRVGGYARINF